MTAKIVTNFHTLWYTKKIAKQFTNNFSLHSSSQILYRKLLSSYNTSRSESQSAFQFPSQIITKHGSFVSWIATWLNRRFYNLNEGSLNETLFVGYTFDYFRSLLNRLMKGKNLPSGITQCEIISLYCPMFMEKQIIQLKTENS